MLLLAAGLTAVLAAVLAVAAATGAGPSAWTHQVGQTLAGGTLLPSHQWVSPLGTRILIGRRGCSRAR